MAKILSRNDRAFISAGRFLEPEAYKHFRFQEANTQEIKRADEYVLDCLSGSGLDPFSTQRALFSIKPEVFGGPVEAADLFPRKVKSWPIIPSVTVSRATEQAGILAACLEKAASDDVGFFSFSVPYLPSVTLLPKTERGIGKLKNSLKVARERLSRNISKINELPGFSIVYFNFEMVLRRHERKGLFFYPHSHILIRCEDGYNPERNGDFQTIAKGFFYKNQAGVVPKFVQCAHKSAKSRNEAARYLTKGIYKVTSDVSRSRAYEKGLADERYALVCEQTERNYGSEIGVMNLTPSEIVMLHKLTHGLSSSTYRGSFKICRDTMKNEGFTPKICTAPQSEMDSFDEFNHDVVLVSARPKESERERAEREQREEEEAARREDSRRCDDGERPPQRIENVVLMSMASRPVEVVPGIIVELPRLLVSHFTGAPQTALGRQGLDAVRAFVERTVKAIGDNAAKVQNPAEYQEKWLMLQREHGLFSDYVFEFKTKHELIQHAHEQAAQEKKRDAEFVEIQVEKTAALADLEQYRVAKEAALAKKKADALSITGQAMARMKRRAEVNGLPNVNAVPAFMFSEDALVKARRLNIYFSNGFERVFRRNPMPRDVTAEQARAALNQLVADMFILKMGAFARARQEQEKSAA